MKNEKGQATVEFALILTIFLMLLGGIIDFGRIMYAQNSVTTICEQAARYASVNPTKTEADIRSWVTTTYPSSGIKGTDITVSPSGGNGTSGQPVTVTIAYTVKNLTPYVPALINPQHPNTYYLSITSKYRIE